MSATPTPSDAGGDAPVNPYVSSNPYAAPQAPPPYPGATPQAGNPYAAPGAYGAGYPAYQARTNPLAIASLIVSLGGLVVFPASVVGLILGHVALRQIAQRGEAGRGLALAGVICGYIITGFIVLGIILYGLLLGWFFIAVGS